MNLIQKHINKIRTLCQTHKVKHMYVFGSVLTPKFNNRSDVDFLFRFTNEIDFNNYSDYYFSLCDELTLLLGREVDLVDEKTLRNPIFIREVEATKQLIYG